MRAYVVDLWGRGLDAIMSGDWARSPRNDIAIKRLFYTASLLLRAPALLP